MENNSYTPAAALADIEASNHAVADRMITPWWYHPGLGLAEATVICALATHLPERWRMVIMGLGLALMALLPYAYKKITGLWIGPAQAGARSRRVWWLLVAIVAVGLGLGFAAYEEVVPSLVAYAAAAVVFVACIVCGRRADTLLREEIRAGQVKVDR